MGCQVKTGDVFHEDGRPFVVEMCFHYHRGFHPCGRYL